MSIKGIKPGQVIPFPNNPVEKKAGKSVENSKFDKTLDKASVEEQKVSRANRQAYWYSKCHTHPTELSCSQSAKYTLHK